MALFRRSDSTTKPTDKSVETSTPDPLIEGFGPARKDRPTPSRREAEAARRQRINRTLTPKEARRESGRQNRAARMESLAKREGTPEKQLMRDYIDSRFRLGEFLLPSLVVILALSFLTPVIPNITVISTILMYGFILAVILDGFLMWRGFKKVLAERLPKVQTKGSGLLFYGMNRCIQIRRFRMPAPRLKRGESF